MVDPLPLRFLEPKVPSHTSTAEGLLPLPIGLQQPHAVQGREHAARGIADLVVPRQVAGVVECNAPGGGRAGAKLAFLNQSVDQLGVVPHLEMATELRVLVLQRVEAVWTGGDYLLNAVAPDRFQVGVHHGLVEALVPDAAGRVARAQLLLAQDREVHPGPPQHPGEGTSHLLVPLVESGCTAHPVEPLSRPGLADYLDVKPLAPVRPGCNGSPEGVPARLHASQRLLHRLGVLGLLHDHVAPQVHYGRHVLDEDRALLHAGPAGDAGPHCLRPGRRYGWSFHLAGFGRSG